MVLKTYVKGVLLGFAGTEYWFVYTLAGLLLVAPVLARAVAHMSRGEKYVVLIVGLAYNAAVSVFRNLGYSPAWGYLLSGWALTFVVGAFAAELFDTPRKRQVLYATSLVSYVGTALLYDAGVRTTMTDTSPLFTAYVLGLYVALLQLGRRLRPSKIDRLLRRTPSPSTWFTSPCLVLREVFSRP